MQRWLLILCLVGLSAALFGAMKLQNQLAELGRPAPRSVPPEAQAAEYAVYKDVLESSTLPTTRQENTPSLIMDLTSHLALHVSA